MMKLSLHFLIGLTFAAVDVNPNDNENLEAGELQNPIIKSPYQKINSEISKEDSACANDEIITSKNNSIKINTPKSMNNLDSGKISQYSCSDSEELKFDLTDEVNKNLRANSKINQIISKG